VNTFDRYILHTTLLSTAIVMMVLLVLFGFLLVADELGRTRADYQTADALLYVLMGMPRLAYQVFPPAAMLGTLMGLGALATHSELTAMRASGLSLSGLLRPLFILSGLLMITMFTIGEWVAPKLDREADLLKTMGKYSRVSLAGDSGLWLKNDNYIIYLPSFNQHGEFENVRLYKLDKSLQIESTGRASTMVFRPPRSWLLTDYIEQSVLADGSINIKEEERYKIEGLLSPELVDLLAAKPSTMSVFSLYSYIDYLQNNNISSYRYELSMWNKLLAPLAIPVMILLAVPFIMGSVRTISVGHRILLGTLFGLVFHIANQAMNYVALVQEIMPALSAITPAVAFFIIAAYRFRRVF
jgi:lipopolysaccharide export system permease protein